MAIGVDHEDVSRCHKITSSRNASRHETAGIAEEEHFCPTAFFRTPQMNQPFTMLLRWTLCSWQHNDDDKRLCHNAF